jgi:hypothetical protein
MKNKNKNVRLAMLKRKENRAMNCFGKKKVKSVHHLLSARHCLLQKKKIEKYFPSRERRKRNKMGGSLLGIPKCCCSESKQRQNASR